MPANNPTSCTLDVRNSASNGDGWTNVTAANGATYSYKYTGGNQSANDGSVKFTVGRGNAAVTVNFASTTDTRYRFDGACVGFTGDNANQLSTQGNAPRTRVINDSCSSEINAQYKVTVTDTTANTTIPCDPMIANVPN